MRDNRDKLAEQLAAAAILRAELAAHAAAHPTLRDAPRAPAEQVIAAAEQTDPTPTAGDA